MQKNAMRASKAEILAIPAGKNLILKRLSFCEQGVPYRR
jgi:hypothetical protein